MSKMLTILVKMKFSVSEIKLNKKMWVKWEEEKVVKVKELKKKSMICPHLNSIL